MLAMLLAVLLLIVVPLEAILRTNKFRSVQTPKLVKYRRTLIRAAVLLVLLVFVAIKNGLSPDELGLGFDFDFRAVIGLAIALAVVCALIVAVFRASPRAAGDDQWKHEDMLPRGEKELRLFLIVALVIGFAWELLFRGYLLWWLIIIHVSLPLVSVAAAIRLKSGEDDLLAG